MLQLFLSEYDKYRAFVGLVMKYDSKSRDTDVCEELKNLLKLFGDDEILIEHLNKLLPKDIRIPQKNEASEIADREE